MWKEFVKSIRGGPVKDVAENEGHSGGFQQPETVEMSIIWLARLDALIMTVLNCMNADEGRGGQRQRLYVYTFTKYLPIAMCQISEDLYDYVKKCKAEDLEMESSVVDGMEGAGTDSETSAKQRVFSKTYKACVPVFVPTVNRAYLSIRHDWFSEFIGDEVGTVYDCYIAEFTEDYKKLNKISHRGV